MLLQSTMRVLLLAAVMVAVNAFVPSRGFAARRPTAAMAKGFADKPKKKAAPAAKPPSAGKAERDARATDYDKMVGSGIPEYLVYFRKAGMEQWKSIGGVAVPRAEKVDCAIFGNIEPLKDAAVRMYPDTKEWFGGGDMEYGYHLKMFPDEPIKVADPAVYQRELDKSKNPFLQWASALTNPLETN